MLQFIIIILINSNNKFIYHIVLYRVINLNCRLVELRNKEVINKDNGCRIGFIDDLVIDTKTAQVCSLIVFGRCKFMGVIGRREEYIIPWEKIDIIGEDTVLVNSCVQNHRNGRRKQGFLKNFEI